MNDMNISLNSTTAYALWTLGAVLIVWHMLTGNPTAALGLLLAGAGGVLTIRSFFCEQARREKAAFDLGRESIRSVR